MKIIIAGAGEVGFHLARLLSGEAQDITLIDTDADRLAYAESHYDVAIVRGDSTSFKILQRANIHEADLLISVTSSGDTNITTCIIGKKLGASKTIARIKNMEYLVDKQILDLKDVGIDELISPESLAAKEIERLIKQSAVTDSFDFGGKLSLIGIHITENAPIVNKNLIQTAHLNPDHDFITVAIHRNGKTIIPNGKTEFHHNDHAYFIAHKQGTERVLNFTGKKPIEINNIMILGGSRTGYHAARRLCGKYNVKLIEQDRDRCFELADQLPDVLVINGDGTNVELLEEEAIQDVDAFIAVSGNSETNILSSLMAKNRGVKKTIAMVENIEYINLSQNIGLDTMINKKLIAANFIFRYIRKGDVISLAAVHGVNAEILEFKVPLGCKIIKTPIKKLNFPKTAIIGGVIRDEESFIPMGEFQIEPGDRVVVFSLTEHVYHVERYFR